MCYELVGKGEKSFYRDFMQAGKRTAVRGRESGWTRDIPIKNIFRSKKDDEGRKQSSTAGTFQAVFKACVLAHAGGVPGNAGKS